MHGNQMYGNGAAYTSTSPRQSQSQYGTPQQKQKKRNVRPQRSTKKEMSKQNSTASINGHMMAPVGQFTQAPRSMMPAAVYSPQLQSLYGNKNTAHLQAQSIYAGLGTPQKSPNAMYNNGQPIYNAQAIYSGLPGTARSQKSPPKLARLSLKDNENLMKAVTDPEAELSPWFLSKKPREDVKKVAVEILRNGGIGEYFVRDVSSQPGALGLSIKTSSHELINYLLKPTDEGGSPGVSIRGTKETFPNLTSLIQHYRSKHRPALPCKLIDSSKIRGMLYYSKTSQPSSPDKDDSNDEEVFGFDETRPTESPESYATMQDVQKKLAKRLGQAEDEITADLQGNSHLMSHNRDSAVASAIESQVSRAMRESTIKITQQLREKQEEALKPLKTLNDELMQKNEDLLTQLEEAELRTQKSESEYISAVEHKLARRKAAVEKRKLQLQRQELMLLQGQAVDEQLFQLMAEEKVFRGDDDDDDTKFGFEDATLQRNTEDNSRTTAHARPYSTHSTSSTPRLSRRNESATSIEKLERARNSSTQVSPNDKRSPHYSPNSNYNDNYNTANGNGNGNAAMADYERLIADPAAMWQYIMQSDAPKDRKLDAARKQLEYLKRQEEFTLNRLQAAESSISRPRVIKDDDTVFDDVFENGTVVDETTGEVFGFGNY
eukprot:m.63655 g.63655  ORF g.63655 m.63655 type:complete len:662 (-) comp23320_c0_seq1:96-2081(-)